MTLAGAQIKLAVLLPDVSSMGGGVTEAVRLIVAALARTGRYDIHVLSLDGQTGPIAHEDWPDVSFRRFNGFGPQNYRFAPDLAWHMLRHRYDIIHIHGIWMFHVLGGGLGMLRGTPAIISPHGMLEPWIVARSPRLKSLVSYLYQDRILSRAHAIHALNTKEADDIRNSITRASVVTIPNFVDQMVEHAPKPVWQNGLDGRKIFLFFGRIHDKKGWRSLLQAWQELCERSTAFNSGAYLIFCGWNDGVDDFESSVNQVAMRTGNVVFAGPQYGQDRVASYRAADYFVLPSQSEGLPMAVLEAVRGEAIVLMSKECNLPAMFEKNAAIATGTDSEGIAIALSKAFYQSLSERELMLNNATTHVDLYYSEERVVAKFEEIYRSALRNVGEQEI